MTLDLEILTNADEMMYFDLPDESLPLYVDGERMATGYFCQEWHIRSVCQGCSSTKKSECQNETVYRLS